MNYPKSFIAGILITILFAVPNSAQGFQMGGNHGNGNHQFDSMRNRWDDRMDTVHQRRDDRRDRMQHSWDNMRERQQNRRDQMRDNWNDMQERRQDRREGMRDNWNDMRNRGGRHQGRRH